MKKLISLALLSTTAVMTTACLESSSTANSREAEAVSRQQSQYEKSQPVPPFDYSLERELVIQLYRIRNENVLTHSVWRSDYGMVQGDCKSMGYGLPYDVSLTNPLVATDIDQDGDEHDDVNGHALTSIEQPEPNGIFASKNTNATWVMCIGPSGDIEPVYVEAKVNVYPYNLEVNYANNRVIRKGKAHVTISKQTLFTKGVTTDLKLDSE